jgi:uncharacterized membrane protein YgcG
VYRDANARSVSSRVATLSLKAEGSKMRTSGMALLVILCATLACLAAEIPGPMSGTFVHDYAGVIPDDKRAEIQAKAQRLKDEYKTEIAVVTIESLEGEESFDYSMRMARSWGIGSKDNEVRGLLILVAVKDRKTAFRTSRHIEGELPDGVTGEISRRMNPFFKNGDFGGGLSLGMDQILERLKVAYEPRPVAFKAPETNSGLGWLWLPLIAVPALGLGYAASRRRLRKRREAELARRDAPGEGFRAWAAAKDPTPVPKAKHKSQGIKRAGSRHTQAKKKGSHRSAGNKSQQGSEPSVYISSSSYDSSSSSYDSGSSSDSDSGSSYSGGSDFGGGGSDSSW